MSSNLKRKAPSSTDASKKAKTTNGNASITSFFGAPKVVSSSTHGSSPVAEAPAVKFDKQKWVSTLTEDQKKLLQLEIDTLDESWLAHLKDEVTSREFLELKRFLAREMAGPKKIFPPKEDVYSWYVNSGCLRAYLMISSPCQPNLWMRHIPPKPLYTPGAKLTHTSYRIGPATHPSTQ